MKASRALLLAVLLTGCNEPITPVTPGPAEDATLRLTANVAGTSVNQLVVTVTASDIPTPLVFNIPVVNGTASGTLHLPPGLARTISVEAFDASNAITHDGSATVDVRPGPNPPISILLRPRAGEVPIVVTIAEVAVEVTPSAASLNPGETVQLTARILGPNDEVLTGTITWATTNPALAKVDAQGLVTAIAAGALTIVAVNSGVAGVSQITVLPGVVTTGSVIITEIMANPDAVTDPSGEWLELHNPTSAPINIEGWTLSDDGIDFHQIAVAGAGLIIQPGGYLVLGINANPATNGGVQVAYQYANFLLANGSDEIVLKNGLGAQVDRVAYGTVLSGRSISLDRTKLDATLNDDAANWCASVTLFGGGDTGTPGAANDLCSTFQVIDGSSGVGVSGVDAYLDSGTVPIGTTDATGRMPRNFIGVHSVHFHKAGYFVSSRVNRDWTAVGGTETVVTRPYPDVATTGTVSGTISNTAAGDGNIRVISRRSSDGLSSFSFPLATGSSTAYSLTAAIGTSDLFLIPNSTSFPAASSFVGYSPGVAVPSTVDPSLVRGAATSFAVTGTGGFPAPGSMNAGYGIPTNRFSLGLDLFTLSSASTSGATFGATVNVPPVNLVYPGAMYKLNVNAFSVPVPAVANYQARYETRGFPTYADLVAASATPQNIVLTDDTMSVISPAHNATGVSLSPTFSWSRVGSPDYVEVGLWEYDPVRLSYAKVIWAARVYGSTVSVTPPATVTLNPDSFYQYDLLARRDLFDGAGALAGWQRNGWENVNFSTGATTPP